MHFKSTSNFCQSLDVKQLSKDVFGVYKTTDYKLKLYPWDFLC